MNDGRIPARRTSMDLCVPRYWECVVSHIPRSASAVATRAEPGHVLPPIAMKCKYHNRLAG
jgi:hypothetical protein